MTKTPSRILNEKSGFLGLSPFDIGIVGYSLIIFNTMLARIGMELLAFPFAAAGGIAILQIRINHRPKIIRDFLAFNFSKRIFIKGQKP